MTSFKLKNILKRFVVFGQQWKKKLINNKFWDTEKTKSDITNNQYIGI